MKRYTIIGVILSLLWIATLVGLIYLKRASASQMTLNEWGDLLSGFVAPLALLWLVLGYLQQGEELRLNTEALKSQQIELQNQVRETAALVGNTERQAAAAEAMADTARKQITDARMRELRKSLNGRP